MWRSLRAYRSGYQRTADQDKKSPQDEKPAFEWEQLHPAADTLKEELLKLYWNGVREDLSNILVNLEEWQSDDDFSEPLPGEDTVDGELGKECERFFKNVRVSKVNQLALEYDKPIGLWQRRALMLLQSAQFLDIDKVFEHRSRKIPLRLLGKRNITITPWKKLSPPGLDLKVKKKRARFNARLCARCNNPIRSAFYHHLENQHEILCEECFINPAPKKEVQPGKIDEYEKRYKACCLPSQLTSEKATELCQCKTSKIKGPEHWPLTPHAEGNCEIFSLNKQIAEHKHKGTYQTLFGSKSLKKIQAMDQRKLDKIKGQTTKLPSLNSEFGYDGGFGTSHGKKYHLKKVPLYLHAHKKNYPFGNVHVSLRFGPVIFENGVSGDEGVVISIRESPCLQMSKAASQDTERHLLLTERILKDVKEKLLPKASWTRTLYQCQRSKSARRIKAVAKQVVGGAFCGVIDRAEELDIANMLLRESKELSLAGIKFKEEQARITSSRDRVFKRVKAYLSSRVEDYVSTFVERLCDRKTKLRFSQRKNSCQAFCDNIIDNKTFGPLLASAKGTTQPSPLYLMSFVCRSNDYISRGPGPLYDSPHGHIEEYLLRYRFGRYDESDVLDTLQEYWHDWGNFEGPLYRYQDLFPWDCTEGFSQNPKDLSKDPDTCNTCSLSRHVWSFPFDSWSLVSLHLSKGQVSYPQLPNIVKPDGKALSEARKSDNLRSSVMSNQEWFRNRLTVLMGQYALLMGAKSMAQTPQVRQATFWIWNTTDDAFIDRVKLGGIIRAQPFSHHFEKGAYYYYYVAPWTSLGLSHRIREYENLRDFRARSSGGLPGLERSIEHSNESHWMFKSDGNYALPAAYEPRFGEDTHETAEALDIPIATGVIDDVDRWADYGPGQRLGESKGHSADDQKMGGNEGSSHKYGTGTGGGSKKSDAKKSGGRGKEDQDELVNSHSDDRPDSTPSHTVSQSQVPPGTGPLP